MNKNSLTLACALPLYLDIPHTLLPYIAAISLIIFTAILISRIAEKQETWDKTLTIFLGIALLSILAYFIFPNVMPGKNFFC